MERILNLIFSSDNVRMLVILAVVSSGYVLINSKMDRMESSLNKRIDSVESTLNRRMDELKYNDIAHLNGAMEALTYALEKNGSLKHEDKEYVDSRLVH